MCEQLKSIADLVYQKCFNLKTSENVLVVTDGVEMDLAKAFYDSAIEKSQEALMVVYSPRSRHGEEPPVPVGKIMKETDVAILSTSFSISHTRARRDACELGVRIASMPMLTADMAFRTLDVDYEKLKELTQKYVDSLNRGTQARLTSPRGTDLVVDLKNRTAILDAGQLQEKGVNGNLPAGEAFIAPPEGTAEGSLVFDGALAGWGMLEEAIKIKVENGKAVEILNGEAAKWLNQSLEECGEKAYNIAELGIGTNEKAKLSGNILEDEKSLGTIHVALGDNKGIGGEVEAGIHLDGMIMNPTIEIDGEEVIKEGKLTL